MLNDQANRLFPGQESMKLGAVESLTINNTMLCIGY
jgi:hypothetical protein